MTQSLEELLFLHRRGNAKFDNLCRFPRTRLWNSFIEVLWLSSNSVLPEIVICLAGIGTVAVGKAHSASHEVHATRHPNP
jgi:hypothetical protein